jgi:hypothetical protein
MKTLARAADRAELLRRLRTVRPESTAQWGRMSAPQMICHLTDAFQMATGDRTVRPTGSWFDRTILRLLVLWLPVRWPRGVPTNPELDQLLHGTSPSGFPADVARVEAMVEAMAAAGGRARWQAHPLFGPLSTRAWLRWGYLHMDHHLRQFGA